MVKMREMEPSEDPVWDDEVPTQSLHHSFITVSSKKVEPLVFMVLV